jgi:mRNA-degrading endonuclease RelE of RelBE toxin-antitoxin system
MKILITEQFNKAVEKLDKSDRKRVLKIFHELSSIDKMEIFQRGNLSKVVQSKENVWVIRSHLLRIFCTFEKTEIEEALILLDVIRKSSSKFEIPGPLRC